MPQKQPKRGRQRLTRQFHLLADHANNFWSYDWWALHKSMLELRRRTPCPVVNFFEYVV
jgi:hypothetical protein